jgi:hypothetical protein
VSDFSRNNVSQSTPDPNPYIFCGVSGFAWSNPFVLARSAQPPAYSLKCLQGAGISSIVNLRYEYPGYNEALVAEALEMVYLHLPIVDDRAASPDQITEYFKYLDARQRFNQRTLIHCAGGRGRVGFMEGVYLLREGWSTEQVFARYIQFGAKIDCENGGNGQIQALHQIGLLLSRGDNWPQGTDQYGNVWKSCPLPDYMADWDYSEIELPPLR